LRRERFITLTVMWALAEMAVDIRGGFVRIVCGDVSGAVGWLCGAVHVLVVFSDYCGKRSGAAGILLSTLVSQHSIVALDCGLFRGARLHEHAEYQEFGTNRVLVRDDQSGDNRRILILGTALVLGFGFPRIGTGNFTDMGIFPQRMGGSWIGSHDGDFQFSWSGNCRRYGGRSLRPETAVPRALKRTLAFLALFYLGGLALVVGIVPWSRSDSTKVLS